MDNKINHHYYVAIYASDNKFYFITELEGKSARWVRGKLPKEFTYSQATRLADGLFRNGYNAVVLQTAGMVVGV